jgi:hypothetical protein
MSKRTALGLGLGIGLILVMRARVMVRVGVRARDMVGVRVMVKRYLSYFRLVF